jgi:hypothetical protein
VVSLESAVVSLAVLVVAGSPLAYLLARDRLPLARLWGAGMLVALMMPPLVIGLLLVFMVGPLTPIGKGLAHVHLTATNTFFALVIAQVYEAAPLRLHRRHLGDSGCGPRRRIPRGGPPPVGRARSPVSKRGDGTRPSGSPSPARAGAPALWKTY